MSDHRRGERIARQPASAAFRGGPGPRRRCPVDPCTCLAAPGRRVRRPPSAHLRAVWKEAAWQRLWEALDLAWGGLPADLRATPTVLRGEAGQVLIDTACRPGTC